MVIQWTDLNTLHARDLRASAILHMRNAWKVPAHIQDDGWQRQQGRWHEEAKHREVVELFSLWGDARVQQALRASHRTFDCFERIAEDMAEHRFTRTAQECRTKTKAMRLHYKRCFTHNQRSGNNPQFCPFYNELHQILKGDASVALFRVADSILIRWKTPPPPFPMAPGSEELFSHGVLTVNMEDFQERPTGVFGICNYLWGVLHIDTIIS